jgi:organic hydroperoxide reductase OsmC/OhrA
MPDGRSHAYRARLNWEGNRGRGTAEYAGYGRRFRVMTDGKPELVGSADPLFLGEPQLHNPEDLLLAAVASCHMLTYLALCSRAGISVVEYADAPAGILTLEPEGGGSFREITLRPRVVLAAGGDRAAAFRLHVRAHELCFIARSCSFPVRHEPAVDVRTA